MHRQTNTYTHLKNKFHPLTNRGWEIRRNRNLTSSRRKLITSVSTWGEFLWQRKSQAEGTKLIEILLKRMYTKMALLFLPFKSSGDITAPGSPHQDHPTKSYRDAPEKQSVSRKGKSCLICHGDAWTLVTHRGHRATREHWHETTFWSILPSHFCCSGPPKCSLQELSKLLWITPVCLQTSQSQREASLRVQWRYKS